MASRQFATFEVAGQLFGVEVHTVQEVLSYNEYTPVPLAPHAVGGLCNDAATRRCDLHRNTGRCGSGFKSPCIPETRRYRRTGN